MIKIQIMLDITRGHEVPEAPEGYSYEECGVCHIYFGESPDWEAAQVVGKRLAEQPGVRSVQVYNASEWES